MIKIFFTVLIVFTFSNGEDKYHYYIEFKEKGFIKTDEISKRKYTRLKKDIEEFGLSQIKWGYKEKDVFDIIDVYKELKDEHKYEDIDSYLKNKKESKSQRTTVHQELNNDLENEEVKTPKKEVESTSNESNFDIKEHITAHRLFLLIVVLIFVYKFVKKRGLLSKKVKSFEEVEEPKTVKKKPTKEPKKEVVNNGKELTHNQIEKKRVELYKELGKSDLDKEYKMPIYEKISQLKENIKQDKKVGENLTQLNQNLQEIIGDMYG